MFSFTVFWRKVQREEGGAVCAEGNKEVETTP